MCTGLSKAAIQVITQTEITPDTFLSMSDTDWNHLLRGLNRNVTKQLRDMRAVLARLTDPLNPIVTGGTGAQDEDIWKIANTARGGFYTLMFTAGYAPHVAVGFTRWFCHRNNSTKWWQRWGAYSGFVAGSCLV